MRRAARLLRALSTKPEPEPAAAAVALQIPPVHDSTSPAEAALKETRIPTAAQKRARTDTQPGKQAECNKRGGGEGGCLLSEFFVQLIFVCEAGGGHDSSHDEWSRGSGEEPRDSTAAARRFQQNS